MKAALITLAAIVGIGLMGLCMVMSSKNSAKETKKAFIKKYLLG